MKNCKKELLTALVAAIKTATSLTAVRTKVNNFETLNNSFYPYIHISDVYQSEDGPKDQFFYPVEVLIKIVYKDIASLDSLYTMQNLVLQIFSHPKPFILTGNFEIMNTELINSSDTEIQIETGILNIGLIRMNFNIIDKN